MSLRDSEALRDPDTGGGLRQRARYTDNEVNEFDLVRPVILGGIDPTAYEQDLVERIVSIQLFPLEKRIDDEAFARIFEEARPRLLGYLLSLVSQVMARIDEVEVQQTRLLGFARIGETVARCLGYENGWFGEEYEQMLEDAREETDEADCVAETVRHAHHEAGGGEAVVKMTSAQLLANLRLLVDEKIIITSRETARSSQTCRPVTASAKSSPRAPRRRPTRRPRRRT